MKFIFSATTAFLVTLALRLCAAPLDEATVTRVVNEVKMAPAHGAAQRVVGQGMIRGDAALHAGPRSRAEILFADRTLARLGAETDLTLRRGSRELTLDRGTLLLEVPAFRGGARVRLGALTAVCGAATVLLEHLPPRSLKIVVLAGDLRVSTGGFFGDSLVIPPGKMLITGLDVKLIPDPVDVDLATLVKTSALIDPARFSAGAAPLASLPRIEKEIARQAGAVQGKRLIPTNLAIVGSGTNVVIPGAPAAAPSGGPAANESGAVASGTNGKDFPKSAEIAVHRATEEAVDSVDSLPEP